MTTIQATYIINRNTYALRPAKAIHYDTIVIEKNKVIYVQQTPMMIIDHSCRHLACSTYEGRRRAVMSLTNFYQKVPIPISIQQQIYFFPTHSSKHIDNCWLSFSSIQHVHLQTAFKHPETFIQFQDGQSLTINVSKHTLQTQVDRTFQVMYQMETNQTNTQKIPLNLTFLQKGSYRTSSKPTSN